MTRRSVASKQGTTAHADSNYVTTVLHLQDTNMVHIHDPLAAAVCNLQHVLLHRSKLMAKVLHIAVDTGQVTLTCYIIDRGSEITALCRDT